MEINKKLKKWNKKIMDIKRISNKFKNLKKLVKKNNLKVTTNNLIIYKIKMDKLILNKIQMILLKSQVQIKNNSKMIKKENI